MTSLDRQIERINRGTGIPVTLEKKIPASTMTVLNRSDQRNTEFILGRIFDKRVLYVSYFGNNELRLLAIIERLRRSQMFSLDAIVVVATQLSAKERKLYLTNAIPFMTTNGEMFLPFIGTRLLPGLVPSMDSSVHEMFSPVEQRLALAILIAQIAFERHIFEFTVREMAPFYVEDGLFCISGGRRFITTIGQQISIKNRATFARATTQLVERGILRYDGETKNRVYSCPYDSRSFFKRIDQFLTSPIQTSGELRLDLDPLEISFLKPLYSGLSGLSKVTMIADEDSLKSFVINRSERKVMDYRVGDEIDENPEADYRLQVSKYDLKGFNELVRLVVKDYPQTVVDPFHLYTMLKEDRDERVQGEVEDLIDQVWNGEWQK